MDRAGVQPSAGSELEMSTCLQMTDGRQLALDDYGHLVNQEDWSIEVAEQLAVTDEMELSEQHWMVLQILREYYAEFGIEPPMRALVRIMTSRGGGEFANSLALYRLFPEGPARQGSRYAGLPIPVSCI